ncbi:cytochrome b [Oecophyllibacter saccharovorans]|nr:cytochrome b N-terminal domain-containing protein [Oecophyllibacter saccharovorans]
MTSISQPPQNDCPDTGATRLAGQGAAEAPCPAEHRLQSCSERLEHVMQWLERRLPFLGRFLRHLVDYPMPPVNWLWTVGACLIVGLALLVASGLFLALFYTPLPRLAFNAINTVERHVPAGWFLRSLHVGGADMTFAALYIHAGRGLWYGSYRAPRELVWWSGLCLLLLFMTTAFIGYVLPWGQMSYWGATVITNAVGDLPLIGPMLLSYLLGADGLGPVALHRFFILHIFLGFMALLLVGVHLVCLHGVGSSNPTLSTRRPDRTMRPFVPYYAARDGLAVCVFLILYAVLVFFLPGWLENPVNLLPADPLHTPPNITPEWYLAPWFAMLRAIPSRLGGLLVAAGSLTVLFLLPWLGGRTGPTGRRAGHAPIGWTLFFAAFLTLAAAGMHPPSPCWVWLSRLAILIWFTVPCVLLPLAARQENRSPTAVPGRGPADVRGR